MPKPARSSPESFKTEVTSESETSKKDAKAIWAAGGVLWRGNPDAPEIGIVHRPRYDDWTLPKGKVERGETLISTATREIAEETGHLVRLRRHLINVAYDLPHGRKHVRYWSAESVGGSFEANHEVDDLQWHDLDSAAALLSYRLDRRVLVEYARLPADLTTLLLVRHAKAGRRARYKGDDRTRPLDKSGREQADALVDLMSAFGVTTLHSADRVRCEQTMEPMRARLDSELIIEPSLAEESYAGDPAPGRSRIRELAAGDDDPGVVRAVCSQGKVIPPLMTWWADNDGFTLPASRNRKGSVWVLSTHRGNLVAANHIDSPLPRDDC